MRDIIDVFRRCGACAIAQSAQAGINMQMTVDNPDLRYDCVRITVGVYRPLFFFCACFFSSLLPRFMYKISKSHRSGKIIRAVTPDAWKIYSPLPPFFVVYSNYVRHCHSGPGFILKNVRFISPLERKVHDFFE